MTKYISGVLFLALIAVPFLAALTGDEPPLPAAEETLLILSPHNHEMKREYARAFAAFMERTEGRKAGLRWIDVGGASSILKELESRFKANPESAGADLLFGGGIDPFLMGKRLGWLAPASMPDELLDGIPPSCAGFPVYDPEGLWFGVALSSFGIIRNQALIDRLHIALPESWDDLARPEFATWIGGGDPRRSGSVHACYEIILQAYGFEKGWRVIAQMCANVRTFGEDGGEAPRAVAAGEVAAGMVIGQYAQRVIQAVGDDRLSYVLPAGTTVITPDSIGMLKGAPNAELAGKFIAFTLSEEGQRLLFQPAGINGQRAPLYRMPVRRALYADPHAPKVDPYAFAPAFAYDTAKGDSRRRILGDLLGAWLIDPHADLTAAWKRVREDGARPEDIVRLFEPPVTEDELTRLAGTWGNSRSRLDRMGAWSRAAAARYRAFNPH